MESSEPTSGSKPAREPGFADITSEDKDRFIEI